MNMLKGNSPDPMPVPSLMPVLSRGKHRTPRSGACFMEFASYLAGEAWSDHPACTHPLVASLARMVNDCTSDSSRTRLVPLIPSVIGLTGDNPRVRLLIAVRAATAALPVSSADHQRALAVGILNCERQLEGLDGELPDGLAARIRTAFDTAPETERWAREFIASMGAWSRTKFTDRTAETIIRVSVQGIAEACTPNPDDRLFELLSGVIEDATRVLAPVEPVETPSESVVLADDARGADARPARMRVRG
ncbi:hypothetical protein E3O44_05830 [Cryobacterium algoricola]|uniref:DUF222 domain-containing protein n=1 Tax=Cryobacterium algoricola TaxID=1259183 RepID=A0ABY2IE60_9MICO|nr:hypothetical protein [Cryobacterium algoricola]TFB88195.1 hypothetical protein E3O44_05830 [Cryobacterium algoricola]